MFIDTLLRWYQVLFSPDHGVFSFYFPYGFCRFSPSCSQYMREAVKRRGVVRGVFAGARRILRCTPWGASTYDPPR